MYYNVKVHRYIKIIKKFEKFEKFFYKFLRYFKRNRVFDDITYKIIGKYPTYTKIIDDEKKIIELKNNTPMSKILRIKDVRKFNEMHKGVAIKKFNISNSFENFNKNNYSKITLPDYIYNDKYDNVANGYKKINIKRPKKNKIFKKYFRMGGIWNKKIKKRKKQRKKKNIKRRYFKKSKKFLNRLRNLGKNNYIDLGIHNRNYMKTDNTSYRTKYLINSPEYSKEKMGLFLKKNKYINMHTQNFNYDLIYKTVPYFFKGIWSGSNTGQTVFDYKKYKVSEENPDYKTFNPIFGLFILNIGRLKRDLLKNNWNYSENIFNIEQVKRKFLLFVSDHDTQFYDDKSIVIQNILFFWLEFFRYIYINRWSLTLNYTNNYKKKNEIKHKYPIAFMHEIYWYKYLTFKRFIKNRILKQKFFNYEDVEFTGYINSFFNKFKLILFKLNLHTHILKENNKNNIFNNKKSVHILNSSVLTNNKIYYKLFKNKTKISKSETLYDKLPNYKSLLLYWKYNNVIIFSKSLFQNKARKSNSMVGFLKPYKNFSIKNPYEITPIIADTETPIKKYLYFLTIKPKIYKPSEIYSDSETNMYISKNYNKYKENTFGLLNDFNKKNSIFSLDINPLSNNWLSDKTKTFKKLKTNNYKVFRNSSRKDSNLKYKRNWFFSNHTLNDWVNSIAYKGSWVHFSDFDPDRQRDYSRNYKHGSKYRLNFNTELWWTRSEVPDYNFRRMDSVGYNKRIGILDSDGEFSHLIKGFTNVVNLNEGADVLETSLPIFERSLLDPESPALNEDGEFPEFDINTVYNIEISKRLNLLSRNNDTKVYEKINEKKIKREGKQTGYVGHNKPLGKLVKKSISDNHNNTNIHNRSYSFKTGNVDWKAENGFYKNLKNEIKYISNSYIFRNKQYRSNSFLNIIQNNSNLYNLNIIDLPDIVDAISIQNIHPISDSTENIFQDLIDQKIDESLEYYSLTGIRYDSLFLNHKSGLKQRTLSWNFLDFFNEHGTSFFENPYGFDYSLILHKYAPKYWQYVLEIDSNWNSQYSNAYPQIQDSVENFSEYLPIWNYDPSIWEVHGYDYEITPIINTDDSKLLLNSKTARYDSHVKWLAQKDLTSGNIQINGLGWGGSNIISGLSNHLPYDMLYASDDDSDFEMYSEYFFIKNWEDADSKKKIKKKKSIFGTTNTATEEYPQSGFFKEIAMKNQNLIGKLKKRQIRYKKRKKLRKNLGKSILTKKALKNRYMYGYNRKKLKYKNKHKTIFSNAINSNIYKKNMYSKYLNNRNGSHLYNTKLSNGNMLNMYKQHNEYLMLYFKRKKLKNRLKISGIKSINIKSKSFNTEIISKKLNHFEHNDILYQIPLGLENNKSRYLSNDFWKLMYIYFISKFDNSRESFYDRDKKKFEIQSNKFFDKNINNLILPKNYNNNWNSYSHFNDKKIKNFNYINFFKIIKKGYERSDNKIKKNSIKSSFVIFNKKIKKEEFLNTILKKNKLKNIKNKIFFLKKLNKYYIKKLKKKKHLNCNNLFRVYGIIGIKNYNIKIKKINNLWLNIYNWKNSIIITKKKNNTIINNKTLYVFCNLKYNIFKKTKNNKITPKLTKYIKNNKKLLNKKFKKRKLYYLLNKMFKLRKTIKKYYNKKKNTIILNNEYSLKINNYENTLYGNILNVKNNKYSKFLSNYYENSKLGIKHAVIGNTNYSTINFLLGTKRGGIGDSSHWSSATEYLNEQFRRKYGSFEKLYNLNKIGIKNSRFPLGGEFESQHTDNAFLIKSPGIPRTGESRIYAKDHFPTTESSEFSAEIMSDIGNEIDDFYDDRFKNDKNLELFSYIDWGFNTDRDQLDSDINFVASDPFTADLIRDPTTESVYLDLIQNEYARELREFPEEIADWTVSDFYSEILDKAEISDIPNSTNESELYSIDSSNSISDYYIGSDDNSDLGIETIHISDEMSTDYNDFDMYNGNPGKRKKFELFNDIVKIQHLSANISPETHPIYNMFSSPNMLLNRNVHNYQDFEENSILESKLTSETFHTDWGDYSKVELEENTREVESFYKQQKYVDSYRIEAILDEFLVKNNLLESQSKILNVNVFLNKKAPEPLSFKKILFFKTNYLKNYRGIMLDLNLDNLLF